MSANKGTIYPAAINFLKHNWPSIFWAAFVLWLSLSPAKGLPHIAIPQFDKLVHFSFYFILASLMYYGWKKQNTLALLHQNPFLKIILIASLYGLSIEVLQETVTNDRYFSLWDELANILGALSGLWISRKLFPFKT
ncbi:MAG: VanZ family protein [Bacteroidetes bacterium]|nr:VanZ family protein [Bacteroidota bacterium]